MVCESVSLPKIVKRYVGLLNYSRQPWARKPHLEIQRGKQTISYQITVSEKQDLQERLANLVTREQAKIPQLGILALTLVEKLMSMLPPLRNRFGVVVADKEIYDSYKGEGPLLGDVIPGTEHSRTALAHCALRRTISRPPIQ